MIYSKENLVNMPEIEIIEKEPWWDDSPFTGQHWMFPTYMVKDGAEHFMYNRSSTESTIDKNERESRKKQLLGNGGMFMRFNGYKDNPLAYLWSVVKRKHSFVPCGYRPAIDRSQEEIGCVDFHGNLKEVSAAFCYRIYDDELLTLVEATYNLIEAKKYDEARETLLNMPPHLAKLSGIDFTEQGN